MSEQLLLVDGADAGGGNLSAIDGGQKRPQPFGAAEEQVKDFGAKRRPITFPASQHDVRDGRGAAPLQPRQRRGLERAGDLGAQQLAEPFEILVPAGQIAS